MAMPKKVLVTEVCPRDGWQNHPVAIPTETKIKYIKKMIDCGARKMEITSFVNPKYVPQMGDAAEVFAGVKDYCDEKGVTTFALTLNKKGVENARAAGFHNVEFVLSASEEHNMRNSRCTIAQSLETFKGLAEQANGLHIILCMPMVFGSPFGDEVPLDRIKYLIEQAESVGVSEFGIADTAGMSDPENTRRVIRAIKECTDINKVGLHMHDTFGMGLASVYAALEEGITMVDSSLGGMGGCPFSPGAKGNIATEDLIHMLDCMHIETGYNIDLLNATAAEMSAEIQAHLVSSQSTACHKD